MRNRSFTIRFPIFNYEMRVIFSSNLKTTCQRLGIASAYPCEACFVGDAKEPKGWLVFSASPDEGTVAHEASHAIQELFRCVGVRRDDETFAYHLDYLVSRIHKFLKRT